GSAEGGPIAHSIKIGILQEPTVHVRVQFVRSEGARGGPPHSVDVHFDREVVALCEGLVIDGGRPRARLHAYHHVTHAENIDVLEEDLHLAVVGNAGKRAYTHESGAVHIGYRSTTGCIDRAFITPDEVGAG